MGLVIAQVKSCAWAKVDFEELKQAGIIGVIITAEKYDRYRAGARIAASAAAYIKEEVILLSERATATYSDKEKKIQRHALKYVLKLIENGVSVNIAVKNESVL